MFHFFSDDLRVAALNEIWAGVESGATRGYFLDPSHLGALLSIMSAWQIEGGEGVKLAERVGEAEGATVVLRQLLPLVALDVDSVKGFDLSMAASYGFSQDRVVELVSLYMDALLSFAWRLSGGDLGRIAAWAADVKAEYRDRYSVAF